MAFLHGGSTRGEGRTEVPAEGPQLVTIFQGRTFTIDVSSWLMGFSIYARATIATLILYYWWRHPSEIVAATSPPPAASAGWALRSARLVLSLQPFRGASVDERSAEQVRVADGSETSVFEPEPRRDQS